MSAVTDDVRSVKTERAVERNPEDRILNDDRE